MESFSALLALCAGNSPVTGEFPAQRPVTRSFDVFFDLRLNKQLSKQSWGWWFEMPSRSLWRHCNDLHNYRILQHGKEIFAYNNFLNIVTVESHEWTLNRLLFCRHRVGCETHRWKLSVIAHLQQLYLYCITLKCEKRHVSRNRFLVQKYTAIVQMKYNMRPTSWSNKFCIMTSTTNCNT